MKDLSALATVVSIDLRGHGESYPFTGAYSMDLLAKDCNFLLDELDIEQAVVCGLSMGGYVTMAMYRCFPDLFKGMILTSTRPGAETQAGKVNRGNSINDIQQYGPGIIADIMLPKLFSPVTYSMNSALVDEICQIITTTSVQGMVGVLQGISDRSDSIPLLKNIRCPTLIIHGMEDQIIPILEAELMVQQIPNSHLVKIGNAGHLPNLDQPEIFNQVVQDFLLSLS
jgi:pimeloyl-ACP methyl ester carboxylesterase